MLGQTIMYHGTRHEIGYRVGFTTGLALQYFLVLATFWSLTVLLKFWYNSHIFYTFSTHLKGNFHQLFLPITDHMLSNHQ